MLLMAVAIGQAGRVTQASGADAAPPTPSHVLTPGEALAQARRTRTAVPVPGSTTPTDTLTANPDGTMTRTMAVQPVRKMVHGSWQPLDATLHVAADGSIVPALTTNGLSLSAGGSAPFAAMSDQGRSLALSLPMALPAPTLSGPTATYVNVLRGVDLQITADPQGGFREVFVVHDAAAAKDPRLASLTMGTRTRGVSVGADAAGNLVAADKSGRAVFTAPAPMAWDSAAAPVAKVDAGVGHLPTPVGGMLARSTKDGPGFAAHRGRIGVSLAGGSLRLTPPALLTAADTVYPAYLDPTWTPTTVSRGGYASVPENYPTSNKWNNTGDPDSNTLQVGDTGSWRAHTMINFPIDPSTFGTATIYTAELDILNTYSYSCTATDTNLYAPAITLTSTNATWNAWFGSSPIPLGPVLSHPNFAYGYTSGQCPIGPNPTNVGFDITSTFANDAKAGKATQTFVLTGASNETSDPNSWKKFALNSAILTVQYNNPPAQPQGLSTSPATTCPGNATTIGDGPVTLYAPVSDPNNNMLNVAYQVWKTSDQTATPIYTGTVTYPSPSIATVTVPEATLKNAAGGSVTGFSWNVQASDDQPSSSPWSTTCSFNFDPTRTGAPVVNPPGAATMGSPITVSVGHPVSGTVPTSYQYQLNAAAPGTVNADASGNASITITPTRFTNTLTITSRSAGGNIGDSASVVFNANPAATAADADLTGDGSADLLNVGVANGLPSGLWLSGGLNNGQLKVPATNIGTNGNGVFTPAGPANFDTAQVITGHFSGGQLQDVLAYYPGGNFAGGAVIIRGQGDGSALQTQMSGNESTISQGTFNDGSNDNPIQLANAGLSSGLNQAYPDLIGTTGDANIGYYLEYYVNNNALGDYTSIIDPLTTQAPDNTLNWNQWSIATAQMASGTAMFLFNKTTGALYLWTNLAHVPYSSYLTYTPYTLRASGWNTGANISLQAADINHDGTPDLWTVGADGTVTSWLVTGIPSTPTITAQPTQTLRTTSPSLVMDAVDVHRNLAINGGFNQGSGWAGAWYNWPNSNFAAYPAGVTGNDPYEGSQFAATNTTVNGGGIYQDIQGSIGSGDTFCATAEVATAGTGSGASGTFALWGLDGPGGSEASSQWFNNLPGGDGWRPVQTCFTATRAHPAIRVQFYPTPNSPTLIIDAVDVHRNLAINGGFNQGSGWAGAWYNWPNSNFAAYPSGVTGNDPYEGSQFAATNTTVDGGGIYQNIQGNIGAGDTFCATAQVATAGSGSGASGAFTLWGLDGPGGSEASTQWFGGLPGGDHWTQVQTCFTATRAHPAIRVQFYPTPNSPTLIIDAVDVHRSLAVYGGFNQGSGPWQVWPQSNLATYPSGITGNDPYEGSQFAATNTTVDGGGTYQDIQGSIGSGDTFCATAQVATAGSGSGASGTFTLWGLDGPGGSEQSNQWFSNLPGGDGWTPVRTCFTATRAHPAIRIQFYPTPAS
jgi:hypothetical protein